MKRVAYETLSKRERKAKHLGAASFIEGSWGAEEEEIVEVVAAHYLEAYRAVPDADDADEIKDRARDMLVRAGERSASLAANKEAQRYFDQAAELTEDRVQKASLLERAGEMAWKAGRTEDAKALLELAMGLFQSEGQTHSAARVSARLAESDWVEGRLEQALERMEQAFAVLSGDEPDEDLATLAAQLGRLHFFKGEADIAAERIETALSIAETFRLPDVLSQALNTKALVALVRSRPEEALALLTHALKVALEHDIPTAALRAYINLAEILCRRDRYEEALDLYREGLALTRRVGDRFWEWQLISEMTYPLTLTGRWEHAVDQPAEIPDTKMGESGLPGLLSSLPEVQVARGEMDVARRHLSLFARLENSNDVQERACYAVATAIVLRAEGRHAEALSTGEASLRIALQPFGADSQFVKQAFVQATEAALALGELGKVGELLGIVDAFRPGELTPFVEAQRARFRARLEASRNGAEGVESGFKLAAGLFREIGVPFWLAVTLAEHGEWLVGQGQPAEAEPLLAEAREIFERLKARPWLERLDKVAIAKTPVS